MNSKNAMCLVLVLLLLFSFVAADVEYSDPKVSGAEFFQLMLQDTHVGYVTIRYKSAAGAMIYDQKLEVGKHTEDVKLKITKKGIEEVSIKGKDPDQSYKLSVKPTSSSSQYNGSYGDKKVVVILSATNFLPVTCVRVLGFDFIQRKKGDELFALDLSTDTVKHPVTSTTEDESTHLTWVGNVLMKDGKATSLSLRTYYGIISAVPCEEKDIKPKDGKAAEKVLESAKDFFSNFLGVFDVEGYGEISFSFNYQDAPLHCKRIRTLIERKWYDGKTFHRLACLAGEGKGRILQGGSSDGKGVKGCEDNVTVPLEAKASHEKWAIGMARTQVPDSANSQFYFCLDDVKGLDGNYTVWGKVVGGTAVLDKIWAENYQGPSEPTPKNKLVIAKCGFRRK